MTNLTVLALTAALLALPACLTVETTDEPAMEPAHRPAATVRVRVGGEAGEDEPPVEQTPDKEPSPAAGDSPSEEPTSDAPQHLLTEDCGFTVRTWPGVDTDGDGQEDQLSAYVVEARPAYEVRSEPFVTVRAADPVTFEVAISSENGCGDLIIAALNFSVTDLAPESYRWLKRVNDDRVPSYLFDPASGTGFNQSAATNMDVTPTGQQLFYAWTDSTSYLYGTSWEKQWVTDSNERVFRFTWTGSAYAPSGTTVSIALTEVTWADYFTGFQVTADNAPQGQTTVGVQIE